MQINGNRPLNSSRGERERREEGEVSEAVRCLIYACVRVHLSANCSLVAVVVVAIVVVAAHVFVYCIL